MKIKAVTIIDTHMVLVGVINHVKTCNDWVFLGHVRISSLKSLLLSGGWKVKKKKKKVIGEHMLILDWQNSKYFVGQLSEMKSLCHVNYIVENLLGS